MMRTIAFPAQRMTNSEKVAVIMLAMVMSLLNGSHCIVNLHNETARMVIYLQEPSSLGPRTWSPGVECLNQLTSLFFKKREHLTRSPNLVMTVGKKMSTPAAQIQEGFLKKLMEAISSQNRSAYGTKPYQMRIISDSVPYRRTVMSQRELILADYYVMVVDSIGRLRKLLQNYVSHMLSWNPGARFLVLYNNIKGRKQVNETAKEIFNLMLEDFYIHRVGLLFATSDTEYSFMLLDYFNSSACRTLSINHFVTCNDGKLETKSLVWLQSRLKRLLDGVSLTNCTFNMCAAIAAPFVEKDCVLGLEMRIVAFIKARLNFNIDATCEKESRGVQGEAGNWSGLLGRLNDRDCDFIIGGFYPDNEVVGSFWVSDCYLQDSYAWFAKLADPRPAWMALYSIFGNRTWMCFMAMLLISWLAWALFVIVLPEPTESREWSLTFINNIAVSLCVSVNERPFCMASRIFFVSLSLYGLNVASTYTSKLISVFSNPGNLHQIDNLREVVEAGIPFGGSEECRDWFENEEDMWIFDLYNESSDFVPTSLNLLYVKMGQRVILSRRMYVLQNSLAYDVYPFKYNIFSSPLQMIMKPGFPFLYEFNSIIRKMRDYGFLQKINRDFNYNNTYLNRIAKMRPEFQEKVIVLTMEHLDGAFFILSLGIGVSVALFVGELMAFYRFGPCLQKPCGQQAKPKKKKRRTKHRKHEEGKDKQPPKAVKEIVLSWEEHNIHKDMRFTPIKRRKIFQK